jgi:hypothetical protein
MRLGLIAIAGATAVASFASVVLLAGGIAAAERAPEARPATPARVDAATFARRIVGLIAENHYAQAWLRLHPRHQQAAPLAEYVSCEKLSPIPGRVLSVTAGRPSDEPIRLAPGLSVPSKAIPVRVVLLDLAVGESSTIVATVHAVRANGRWTWILPQARLAEYAAGRCAGAPPSTS